MIEVFIRLARSNFTIWLIHTRRNEHVEGGLIATCLMGD